jgi:hypothetical protein
VSAGRGKLLECIGECLLVERLRQCFWVSIKPPEIFLLARYSLFITTVRLYRPGNLSTTMHGSQRAVDATQMERAVYGRVVPSVISETIQDDHRDQVGGKMRGGESVQPDVTAGDAGS